MGPGQHFPVAVAAAGSGDRGLTKRAMRKRSSLGCGRARSGETDNQIVGSDDLADRPSSSLWFGEPAAWFARQPGHAMVPEQIENDLARSARGSGDASRRQLRGGDVGGARSGRYWGARCHRASNGQGRGSIRWHHSATRHESTCCGSQSSTMRRTSTSTPCTTHGPMRVAAFEELVAATAVLVAGRRGLCWCIPRIGRSGRNSWTVTDV